MGILDSLLAGNRRFQENDWDPNDATLDAAPIQRLAVVACMDTRYNVERVLGLGHGDAKIIRNAGNVMDDDAVRGVVVAIHLLGVERVAVLGHTKCGMSLIGRGETDIVDRIRDRSGDDGPHDTPEALEAWLAGFHDVFANVRAGMQTLRGHPYVPDDTEIVGLVYDNDTGEVHPVEETDHAGAQDAAPPNRPG